jgi:hypothetical protein
MSQFRALVLICRRLLTEGLWKCLIGHMERGAESCGVHQSSVASNQPKSEFPPISPQPSTAFQFETMQPRTGHLFRPISNFLIRRPIVTPSQHESYFLFPGHHSILSGTREIISTAMTRQSDVGCPRIRGKQRCSPPNGASPKFSCRPSHVPEPSRGSRRHRLYSGLETGCNFMVLWGGFQAGIFVLIHLISAALATIFRFP